MTDEAQRQPLLQVRDLKVHFPIKRGIIFDRVVGHVRAVDGVDLTIYPGQTYGLVGESGCGKSTLGRAVLRLNPITAGSVTFDGMELTQLEGEPLRAMRRRMQMIFQDPLSSLDPRQNVESILTRAWHARHRRGPGGATGDHQRDPGQGRPAAVGAVPAIRMSSPVASASGSGSPGRWRSARI